MKQTLMQEIAKKQEVFFVETLEEILKEILPNKRLQGDSFNYWYEMKTKQIGRNRFLKTDVKLKGPTKNKEKIIVRIKEFEEDYSSVTGHDLPRTYSRGDSLFELGLDKRDLNEFSLKMPEFRNFLNHLATYVNIHKYAKLCFDEFKVQNPYLKKHEGVNWNFFIPDLKKKIKIKKEEFNKIWTYSIPFKDFDITENGLIIEEVFFDGFSRFFRSYNKKVLDGG